MIKAFTILLNSLYKNLNIPTLRIFLLKKSVFTNFNMALQKKLNNVRLGKKNRNIMLPKIKKIN